MRQLCDDDDELESAGAGEQHAAAEGSGGGAMDVEDEQDLLRVLQGSDVWELNPEAEGEFREPINMLAAQTSLFGDGDLPLQGSGAGEESGAGAAAGSPAQLGDGEGCSSRGAGGAAGGEGDGGDQEPAAENLASESEDDSWLG